jgi:hypothetical protein
MSNPMNDVARGVSYLAERTGRNPLAEINVETFDIRLPCSCAAGQMMLSTDGMAGYVLLWQEKYDEYESADALPEGTETAIDAADQWMRDHGFLWSDDDDITSDELQRAWLTVICAAQNVPVPRVIWPSMRNLPPVNIG